MAPIGILVAVCIALPLAYAWRVARLDAPSRVAWLVVLAEAAVVVALVLLLGRWDIVGLPVRWLLVAALVAAALWSLHRNARRPWRAARPVWRTRWANLLGLVPLATVLAYLAAAAVPRGTPADLVFPLRDGRFVVAQGGGVALLNHHAGHDQQAYAADITAVGPAGFRVVGLLPRDPGRYVIFGAPVVSPCNGAIIEAGDGLPDLPPPQADRDNPAGNHVVVDCGALHVTLAHLQRGTVAVSAGETVSAGDRLGRVGNSGNTTEPHLHVHAIAAATGRAVPMAFDGRVPIRNRVFARDGAAET